MGHSFTIEHSFTNRASFAYTPKYEKGVEKKQLRINKYYNYVSNLLPNSNSLHTFVRINQIKRK